MGVVNFCDIYCRKNYSKGLTSHKVIQWPIGFAKNAVVKHRDTNQIFISCCQSIVKCAVSFLLREAFSGNDIFLDYLESTLRSSSWNTSIVSIPRWKKWWFLEDIEWRIHLPHMAFLCNSLKYFSVNCENGFFLISLCLIMIKILKLWYNLDLNSSIYSVALEVFI